MNHIEKHETLIAEGWSTRVDGLLRPPLDWPDQRPRTAAAAWHDHLQQAEQQPDPAA